MKKFYSTSAAKPKDFNIPSNEDGTWTDGRVGNVLLAQMRNETRRQNAIIIRILASARDASAQAVAQTTELCKQTAILDRIDERLKRNGMSLAKRNRR